ncbi:hypothetical protein [Cupriavidus plantarum]|uniref:Uncharacterized protein n=1 Tax=Cupriavidus plantarum TaxID=942865 RepID=A0A316EX42_9BURK|nr:hypothetical protein [Cupriavidus plantarum]PWK37284.1 hypothetical protein C7419_1011166 [Cupriavidus plantarum]REF01979.1 hypothetical protein C7418_0770 [Cupriavidus plantarum]RLK45174.1 hypothetical protein C7417_1181 [Cupriavidus plantarum]
MSQSALLDYPALLALARASDAVTTDCGCVKSLSTAWESQPVSFPEEQLKEVGTLRESDEDELTFDEYHPDRTQFWSPEAPIAPRFYPANRCDVWGCTICGRHFLRYVEGGGYFVDRRIRKLSAALLVDATR